MLSIELHRSISEASELFLKSQYPEDISEVLEIPLGQLIYLLYKKDDSLKYNTFYIPKKRGGNREISSPISGVGILQKKLLYILENVWRPRPWVQGFVKDRSILTNSKYHRKKTYVLNIDLENFYGSINFGRVRGLFMAYPFNFGDKAATIIAQLATYKGSLPQGASTSPIISNMIAYELDNKLIQLARKHHLIYTRYADDISFSTTKKYFPEEIATYDGSNPITGNVILSKKITNIIKRSGFNINEDKIRLQLPCVRQVVTGLTANEFPNVSRKYIRNIRAMIFAWKKFGLKNAEREYIEKYSKYQIDIPEESLTGNYYKNVLYGKLSFLKMIRGAEDQLYIKYCLEMADLDKNPPKQIIKAKEMYEKFDVFICHASEDKSEIARPIFEVLTENGIISFLDEKYIKWGDSFIEKINQALGKAKYVIAIISNNSVNKAWPIREINVVLAREISGKQKILPLMVGSKKDIEYFQDKIPLISDKKYLVWNGDVNIIYREINGLLTT